MNRDNRGKVSGRNGRRGNFLARLRRDERGNTLAIMAAALIPMIGMVGSAVDISRAYLVKTRLQQACDAGVLAARRTMTGISVANDTNARTQATNFFNINLKTGAYGATVTPITVTDAVDANNNATGVVDGTASATVPTTLMRIFGKTSLTMTATCESELQVSNIDVMFVLDTTGSMNCAASDTFSTCSNNNLVEKSNARIKALRTAVVNFYNTVDAAVTSGSQLRIGFVPYSTTVNVGSVLPASYFVDSWNYQSRVANFNTAVYVPTYSSPTSSGIDINGSSVTQAACATYGQNSGTNPSIVSGGPPPANTVTKLYSNDNTAGVDWGWSGAPDTSGNTQSCRRHWTQQNTTYATRYSFTNWINQQTSYDTSQYKATLGTSNTIKVVQSTNSPSASVTYTSPTKVNEVDVAAADPTLPTVSTTWKGCIEERDTASGTSNFSPIPSTAYDLNIDLIPDGTTAKQWRPLWPELIWGLSGNNYFLMTSQDQDLWACPKAASKLTVMSASDVSNYVNASDFKAVGYTYHDTGMLWGTRLLSPTGLFASENATAPNGKPISRNIIFMTDGDMETQPLTYNMYGHEQIDRRVTGTSALTNLQAMHNARFLAICAAAKNMNINIWVVAYAQTMTTQLQTCASPGKAFYAADDASLNTAFQTIAQQIAELRLSR
jgi:Flp pilus assembly protein TadG